VWRWRTRGICGVSRAAIVGVGPKVDSKVGSKVEKVKPLVGPPPVARKRPEVRHRRTVCMRDVAGVAVGVVPVSNERLPSGAQPTGWVPSPSVGGEGAGMNVDEAAVEPFVPHDVLYDVGNIEVAIRPIGGFLRVVIPQRESCGTKHP